MPAADDGPATDRPCRPGTWGVALTRGVPVAQSASISANIAGRYAQAVFDIARQDNAVDSLAAEVEALDAVLKESADLRAMLASPVVSREDQGRVVDAIAQRMGLGATLRNTLALMAENRRLFALPQLVARLGALIAEARGEVTAEVVSAQPLTEEQSQRLTRTLAEISGKTVKLNARVDEGLIGGMIVRLGSRMIDTSIRSKLGSLQNVMKEVG